MSQITLEAVLYEGDPFVYDTDDHDRDVDPPIDETGALLALLGFRQSAIYDNRYDTRLVLDSPVTNGRTLGRVQPGNTIVYDKVTMTALVVLNGDRTEKSKPKRATKKAAGGKVAAKDDMVEGEDYSAPGDYRWR